MNKITKEDLQGLNHRQLVYFALFCAKQVVHLNTDERAHKCISVVEKWLNGEASTEEVRVAAYAVYAAGYAADYAGYAVAAGYVARYAAYAAGYAAYAVVYAAGYADAADAADAAGYAGLDKDKILEQQHTYLYELKNIDKIIEEEMLR